MGRNRHSPSNSIHHSHRPPPLSLDPSTGVLLPAAKRSTAPPLVVEPVIAPVNNRGTSFPPALSIRPPTKAESTRVQLQRQRLREQHAAVVVSQRLPGLKTSTGKSRAFPFVSAVLGFRNLSCFAVLLFSASYEAIFYILSFEHVRTRVCGNFDVKSRPAFGH